MMVLAEKSTQFNQTQFAKSKIGNIQADKSVKGQTNAWENQGS